MKPWHEKLVIAVLWVALGWIAWDFVHWIDPPYRNDPEMHPARISPRGLN